MTWAPIEDALAAFRRGEFVMVMDSDDREDECDLVIAAEHIRTDQMAFAIRYTTGIVCVVADQARLELFGLHPATGNNTDKNATNFYVATDFLPGTTTGVSAADRAATARAFCDTSNPAEAFSKPGHLFPLCARPGGVLERQGHTESAYDLCRLTGIEPVSLIAELMKDDGTMFRAGDSLEFGRRHKIPVITVAQIIEYRRTHGLSEASHVLPAKGMVRPTPLVTSASAPTGPPENSVARAHRTSML